MYLALRGRPRRAREAATIAGLERATGYRILSRLLDRGMVTASGQHPQRFEAVSPSILFRRLELFYRDEAEIPNLLGEAFGRGADLPHHRSSLPPMMSDLPRVLAHEHGSIHPVVEAILRAKHSVGAVIEPLSAPVTYRIAMARALGRLARKGVRVRVITDARPADYRFSRAVLREANSSTEHLEFRHYSPLASQLYLIDRLTIVRIPTLAASTGAAPVGVVIDDQVRVQSLVSRFEALWTEATAAGRIPGSVRAESPRSRETKNHGSAIRGRARSKRELPPQDSRGG